MKISRRFTKAGQDVFSTVDYEKRTSRISNPDGSVVFEMNDAEIPKQWSQLATDIMVSKYFRKAGVPQTGADGKPLRDADGRVVTGPEKSARQVINRLAGCWRHWGETHNYFESTEDAQAFYDELSYMLLHQMCAPNSPQWFNTGLNFAYGISGPAQGHLYCDPKTGELKKSADAYTHPQPHACQPFRAPVSTPNGNVPIGKIVQENLVGLEVLDGTEGGSGTTRVLAIASNGVKQVFRVVLEDGKFVEATADHLVYAVTSDGMAGRWVRVDSLDKGMSLMRSVRDRAGERAISKSTDATKAETQLLGMRALTQVKVRRIEPLGEEMVYDIQTASGQYLCDYIVVHNCFIQSVSDDLVNDGGIMDLWTREARLFKYGSGTGSNFSKLRGDNEPLSGGGKSSGLMSFLKIGDRAAGAIKSGGTTRRAAKMVCLDLDHPDIENFVNWKVREELKVAALAEGMKHLSDDQKALAARLRLRLDYDFNGEGYATVSGQNSNNSVRIPNAFFEAVETDGQWELHARTSGKIMKTLKARDLWDQVAFAAWRCADPGVQYDDTINEWHTCPKSGRINASNPCVTGDTRVLTPGGVWRRIDSMIHLPARIVTNLETQEINAVDGAFPTGTKDVYELKTVGGYSLKLTADHRVWTKSRGWVEAQFLTTDDEVQLISQPATIDQIGEPQDHRFFQLLGLLLSTTNSSHSAINLDACLSSDSVEEFAQYAANNWSEAVAGSVEGNTLTATLTNRRLISRLRGFIRTDDGQRRLSDEAFTVGLAAQRHLLRALFHADGTFDNSSITLHSDSSPLLEDAQLLLLGFGIQSSRTYDGGAVAHGGMPSDRLLDADLASDGARTPARRAGAADHRHGLRIDPGSLRFFADYIGLLPGQKLERLAAIVARTEQLASSRITHHASRNTDRVTSLTFVGTESVYDLTEPVTHSFIANGITVHNCSEYMFLDDTACNLASLNVLTFFDSEHKQFDIEAFKHGTRLWTIVLEISVLMASFPSEAIAKLSYKFRTLGLGFANLGAMLMQSGIPYDSERGRAICAALSAILTGESYATSAEMARELGAFAGYEENKADMLRVIRNHRRAAYDVTNNAHAARGLGGYESLAIKPIGINSQEFGEDPLASRQMLAAAQECWDRALLLGERHGFRNAQTTVIAPTGTIGLLMDCDTTGVEPDFALVKFKKLAGGGYFKIANQSLAPALVNLGYTPEEINDIMKYVMGTLTLHDAPAINWQSLAAKGFTVEELNKIENALPGTFELGFAFSAWSLGESFFRRMEIAPEVWQAPGFNLLRNLGFTRKQIDAANDIICGKGTVEGAPLLKSEHLPVFDCANRCGKTGERFIHVDGHIRMMAAAQPFITGAISKTINLPNEATIDDIKRSYELSWKLGLKANALYRDGSKLSQPLNAKSDKEVDEIADEDDADNVEAAREEVAVEVANGAAVISSLTPNAQRPTPNLEPVHTSVIGRIIERIVERPLRRRLPDTRNAVTHKFDVAGHEGYITAGLYDDGSPGEVFITMAKEGSTIGGLMDAIATLVSVSLQYGVPVESLVRKFEHVRFEPSGMTRNREIPMAKSLVDYIFRWLAMEFVPGYREVNAPNRPAAKVEPMSSIDEDRATPEDDGGNASSPTPNAQRPTPNSDMAATTSTLDKKAPVTQSTRMQALSSDPLSQQSSNMQADAPACDTCGSITVRSGTCYKCLNCGNSMGCS